jgi:hypothetical protein
MNHALIVAGREIREKSRLFLLAAILSVMPFLVLALPNVNHDRTAVLAACAAFVSVALLLGLSVLLGVSTIGRELTERRLSFYFARPLSAGSIWGGKVMASLSLALLSFLIAAAPVMIVLSPRAKAMEVEQALRAAVVFMGASIILFFLGHAISTMARSRSAIAGLDIALAALSVMAFYAIVHPAAIGLGYDVFWFIAPIVLAIVIVLALAPVFQLSRGRTDARRSHAALSLALWSGVAIVIVLAFLAVAWLRGGSPTEFEKLESLEQAPNSSWALVSGSSRSRFNYRTAHFVNTATGERERLRARPWSSIEFSGDGRVAAWLQPHEVFVGDPEFDLYVRPLTDDARAAWTGIRLQNPKRFELSQDGSRVAVVQNDLLAVYDVKSRDVLASVRSTNVLTLFFAAPDVVRVIEAHGRKGRDTTLTVRELNIPAKTFVTTGTAQMPATFEAVSFSPDHSRMLVRGTSHILDGRTAAPVATLPVQTKWFSAAMLRDGTVIDSVSRDGKHHLRVFSRDGAQLHDIVLPGVTWASPAGQLPDGNVVLSGVGRLANGKRSGQTMFVVDPVRGTIVKTSPDVYGAAMAFRSTSRLRQLGTQQLAAVDGQGKLVLWNPQSGETAPFPR